VVGGAVVCTPVTAPQASTPANTPTVSSTTPTANPSPLLQVADKITSLVSQNGTHRISLTLNPDNLGEVRVVMAVRDGMVHVRLAAGHEARAALLDGSGELNRMLTQAGAIESHVVVRELPGSAVTATHAAADSQLPDLGAGSAQPDARQPQDQHARTRADQPATDGTDTDSRRASAASTTALRSTESVTSIRGTGLDVTM
jgi:hypothetical protein